MSDPQRRSHQGRQDAGFAEPSVVDHVRQRVAELRIRLASQGTPSWPPTLALGTFERVGSNWFLDTERLPGNQHNEPFRQQLHPTHCLSTLTAHPCSADDLSVTTMHPLALHWLTTFVATKYAPVGQVVKETNLFFATDAFLALFPDADLLVLCRSPIGIASSFERGNLFDRWGYAGRYHQLRRTCRNTRHADLHVTVPDDQPSKLQMLARLIVLNAVLLSAAIGERAHSTLTYEARFVAQRATAIDVGRRREDRTPVDDVFDTRRPPTRLINHLSPSYATEFRRTIDQALDRAQDAAAARAFARAQRWLTDDPMYAGATPPLFSSPRRPTARLQANAAHDVRFVPTSADGLLWRTTLITNREVSAFLDRMRNLGVPNVIGGVHLFVNEAMPHGRGGRIRRSDETGGYDISPGYEEHPAYWITWLGAAALAVSLGARLPLRREIEKLASLHEGLPGEINADHRVGDVTPVVEPGKAADAIHHRLGNLQVWCADGPPTPAGGGQRRYFYGVAWDTPATVAELRAPKSRHITGCSRGIGVRLVRDSAMRTQTTDDQLAHRLLRALAEADPALPLDEQDLALILAVSGDSSEADVALDPHVGASTREP